MALTRAKSQGRRSGGTYVQLPHAIIQSHEYAELNAHAVKLLIDLFIQYRGDNNGDFTAAWKIMCCHGWSSRDTLSRALNTLLESGWIIKTRQGGCHKCSLYAVSWLPIDECDGKLDIAPTRVAAGTWKQLNNKSVTRLPCQMRCDAMPINTPTVSVRPFLCNQLTRLPCPFYIYQGVVLNCRIIPRPKGMKNTRRCDFDITFTGDSCND